MKNLGKFYNLTNRGQAPSAGTSSGIIDSPNEYQTAVVYDVVSEGPIEGLVHGTDSIYLNRTPATIGAKGDAYNIRHSPDVTYTASTNTVVDNSGKLFAGLSVDDGERTIRIVGARKNATGILTISAGSTVVTASSAFFNTSTDASSNTTGQHINIVGAGVDGGILRARIVQVISTTQARIDRPASTTVSSVDADMDLVATIASITNDTTAVVSTISEFGTTDQDSTNVAAYISSPKITADNATIYNHENFAYAFMNGHRDQPWLGTFRGIGSSSIVYGANQEILQTDLSSITGAQSNVTTGGYTTASGNATASAVTISASTMGITNQPEIDKLKLNFKFPTMIAIKKSSGDEAPAHVELRIFLGFKRAGDSSFTEVLVFGPTNSSIQSRPSQRRTSNFAQKFGRNNGFIQAETKAPFVESFTIDLQEFQPFSDFQVKIERVNPVNARHGDYDHTNPCTLTSIEAIITDRLSYPLSAYGAVIFDAQSFSQIPTRGYEIKGLKVQVPTNYFPKGEGGRVVGEYDRHVTTGADSGGYVNWDGNFRGDIEQFTDPDNVNYGKVWTDNPAWIFYDLVINDRYGIGKYISKDQIDKYELFKIARYCDELVDNGRGGTEPRFTCNLYLQEKAEALKVLQDVTSVFRGMLYWLDGEIQFSQNRYQNPIYSFSKANVIGGLFKYTSSKEQYRSNQIRVTWNDPEAMYKKAVEIVEDTNNILETGRIVSKDVVAFGCTSRGQAHRFGKWTILTELLETEGVSFNTSINAGFLKPGDVVLIQDADVDNIRYSGRLNSGSTTTSIKIDSAVNLGSTNTNKLSIVYPNGGAYLAQESATINSVAYKRGDLITQALIDGTLTTLETSAQAYNSEDDSGNAVELNWSNDARVETQTISSTGNSATLTTAAFSSAPPADAAWAIREVNSAGVLQDGSALQYVITSINESEPTVYEIQAVKYDPAKFDLVDRGYVLDVGIDTNKPPSYQDAVPVPKSVTLSLKKNLNASTEDNTSVSGGVSNVLHVSWQHPTSIRSGVSSKYEHLSHYEIRHNMSGKGAFESLRVGKDDNFINLPLTNYGVVTVQIRTVSTAGTKSEVVQKKFDISNQSAGINAQSRIGLLPTGGQITKGLSINTSTGVLSVASSTYDFIAANGEPFEFTATGVGNYQQAFNGMGASASAYLVFDADDTSDHLKAVEIKTDTTAVDANSLPFNFEYLAEVGASNDGLSSATGTVSIAIEENTVTGSSTTFRTDYSVGDKIVIDGNGGTTRFFATVTHIESDTQLEIDNIVPRAYSGSDIKKLSYKPDFTRDTILAKVTTDSSTVYTLAIVFAFRPGADGAAGAAGVRGGSIFNFEESSNSNITAAVATGFAEHSSDTFANSDAVAVAAAVIADASDSNIRPNDRITVTDTSAGVAGTRVYTGSAASSSGSVTTSDFSSLVTETFNGSVIVDGTLSADKLTANTTLSNNLNVGSNLVLATGGKFYSANKTSFTDTDAGFYLDTDGDFVVGDSGAFMNFDASEGELEINLDSGRGTQPTLSIGSGTDKSFVVDGEGKVTARNLILKDSDGEVYFDSATGFSNLAKSQLLAGVSGVTVETFSASRSNNTNTIAITTDSAISVSLKAKLPVTPIISDAISQTVSAARGQIPSNITIAIKYSTNSDMSSATTAVTQQFTADTTGTFIPDPADGSGVSSTEYHVGVFGLLGFNYGFISNGNGAVSDAADLELATSSNISLNASTTYYFRAEVTSSETANTDYNLVSDRAVETLSRALEITSETSGEGFSVASDGLSGTGGSGGSANNATITLSAGTGLSGGGDFTTNQSSNETITFNSNLTAGTGISISGATITNSAPDQTVSLTGSGATSVSGTYPNFTISSTDTNTNTNYFLNGISKSGNTLTFSVSGTSNQSYTFGSNAFNSTTIPTNTNQLTNGAGFVTSSGVTSVATGNGLSGGTITSTGTLTMSGSYTGAFSATGNITAFSSDERLKNITGKIEHPLDKISKINGYYFEWNEIANEFGESYEKDITHVGVKAQEIQEVLPEVVSSSAVNKAFDTKEEYLTVQYEKIVPLLIEGIKELKKEVDELKKNRSD